MTEQHFLKKIESNIRKKLDILCSGQNCGNCIYFKECTQFEQIEYDKEETFEDFKKRINRFLEHKLLQYKANILSKKI